MMNRRHATSLATAIATGATATAARTSAADAAEVRNVGTEDRSINPELERRMARRAGSAVTEIAASHAVIASQPGKIAAVIEAAAREAGR